MNIFNHIPTHMHMHRTHCSTEWEAPRVLTSTQPRPFVWWYVDSSRTRKECVCMCVKAKKRALRGGRRGLVAVALALAWAVSAVEIDQQRRLVRARLAGEVADAACIHIIETLRTHMHIHFINKQQHKLIGWLKAHVVGISIVSLFFSWKATCSVYDFFLFLFSDCARAGVNMGLRTSG